MRWIPVAAAWLLTASAWAQLQLYRIPGMGLEEPAGDVLDFGEVPTGDYRDIRLRIRNLGQETIVLTRFRIRSADPRWFRLEGHPSIPYAVAPGTNVDFRVRFQPPEFGSFSATLHINELTVMLFGSSPPTVELLVEEEEGLRRLTAGEVVVLGRVQQGRTLRRRFRLRNPAFRRLRVEQIAVEAGFFAVEGLPPLPLDLEPGSEQGFEVVYEPLEAGIHQAILSMDGREFVLEGVAYLPPFPDLEIHLTPQTLSSGQQAAVSLRLAEPAPAGAQGSLEMVFTPAVEGAFDDPAIGFLTGDGRRVALSIEKGERDILIAGAPEAVFQTGTTAGTIEFRAEIGGETATAGVTLPPEPVRIDTATWRPTATGLELRLNGFDNTLSTATVSFRFYEAGGRPLTEEPLRSDVAAAFRDYFATSYAGGLFSLRAEFPVAGDVSLLEAVEVQFENRTGPSKTVRIELR